MAESYLADMFSLKGKTAIVTGGTGGLGSAMVVALVQAGLSLVVSIELPDDPLSLEFEGKIHSFGTKIMPISCDLQNSASLRETYQMIWEAGVVPDILLNCAGLMRRDPCLDAMDDELSLLFNVNVKPYYVSMQEFGRKLILLGNPGQIINIASITAFQAGFSTSIYSSTKRAVVRMTEAFSSNEWAKKGIQVDCIAPGFMQTTMTAKYEGDPIMTEYLMTRVYMQRWGKPEDLASAVLFLAAPSNTFVSCLVVDSGFAESRPEYGLQTAMGISYREGQIEKVLCGREAFGQLHSETRKPSLSSSPCHGKYGSAFLLVSEQ
ncbi:NAD(P)-binding protein [Thozetella sp. PMI_491]|nr:NAD(P)-binding protein [Thozetella sp. PMI_491]